MKRIVAISILSLLALSASQAQISASDRDSLRKAIRAAMNASPARVSDNGEIYKGRMRDGHPHGIGAYYADDKFYMGRFMNGGLKTGHCSRTIIIDFGVSTEDSLACMFYAGAWVNGKKSGLTGNRLFHGFIFLLTSMSCGQFGKMASPHGHARNFPAGKNVNRNVLAKLSIPRRGLTKCRPATCRDEKTRYETALQHAGTNRRATTTPCNLQGRIRPDAFRFREAIKQ